MAFGWAGAGAGASDALQELLAKRMLAQYQQAQLAQRQTEEANQQARARDSMDMQRRTFAADEAERAANRERQGRMDARLAQQDEIAAADRRETKNKAGVRSMILEGMLQKRTDPRTAQLMAAGEGVEIEPDVLDPEKAQRDRIAQIQEQGRQTRLSRESTPAGQDWVIRGGKPIPIPKGTAQPGDEPYDKVAGDPTGMRALAELAARSGQLPEGTPTQQGAVMRGMAGDPALMAQYEQKRMEPIRAQAQTIMTALDDLVTKEGELTPGGKALFGEMTPVFTRQMGMRPATVAANASLRQITGQQVVDLIREMKDQSRTGATGFGQLNRRELDIILAATTRLTQRVPEATAKQDLKTLREKFGKILQPATSNSGSTGHAHASDTRDALLDELLGGR